MNADPASLVDILSDIQLTTLNSELFDSNQSHHAIFLDNANLKEFQTPDFLVEQAFIADTDFSNSKWTALELIEVLCRNCNAANVHWSLARMRGTEFHRTRLTGCDFSGTSLRNVLFYRCKLDFRCFMTPNSLEC